MNSDKLHEYTLLHALSAFFEVSSATAPMLLCSILLASVVN